MAGFNIGDCYRAAGLQVGADLIGRRLKVFEALRKDATTAQVVDLSAVVLRLAGRGAG